jgi:hypothetical protein
MASFSIDDDAVGQVAIGHDGLAVVTVRIHRVDTAGIQLEHKQTWGNGF